MRHDLVRALAGCALLAALSPTVVAEVRLARVFQDRMVLQQEQQLRVWGWADPGESVTIDFHGVVATAVADQAGKWIAPLGMHNAGGPFVLTATGAQNTVQLDDVLVGDVYICSGQSNMELRLAETENAAREIVYADYPEIRFFTVRQERSRGQVADLDGYWNVCTPETATDFSAVAYYFGREIHRTAGVPVGLVQSAWSGSRIEAWMSRESVWGVTGGDYLIDLGPQPGENRPPRFPGETYNTMVRPLMPMAIRAVLWYQGESNVSDASQYQDLFPALIRDWREGFRQGEVPFYFVQIAPFRYQEVFGLPGAAAAELREAQAMALGLAKTGMVVTMDVGDVLDVHPRNKLTVGKRLAGFALRDFYEERLEPAGPLYDAMSVEGNEVRVRFTHIAQGLTTDDGNPPSHFQVAGIDRVFHPAHATILNGEVAVWSPLVDQPVSVRYAWDDDAEPNLCNLVGLPASPFRTDDWPGVTD